MSMSTFPIGFPESTEQSLCPELSDELTMALAAGEWWAIMEVSHPISEEPEYGDLTSGLWWGTVEAGETPCPTSGTLPDNITKRPKLKIPEPLRRELLQQRPQAYSPQGAPMSARSTQGAPVPTKSQQGAPVHGSSKKGSLTSALFFTDASEKDLNSDATLKTTEQQRKWRQKKPQEAPVAAESPQKPPVPTGFPHGAPVPKSLQRPPVPAPKVLACFPRGALMPEKVPDRRKLNIPEPLGQEQQQQKPQAPSLQGTLPDKISKRPKLKIPELLRGELLLQRPQASSLQGAPFPDKTSKREKLEVLEPLRRKLLQLKPQA
ncbi:hypothetical protein PO909_013976 [Leuciscus waleckii]